MRPGSKKINLLSTNINPIINKSVTDYKSFQKLTGYRLDDIDLNKKDPGLFVLLLESFFRRVLQERYWYKKHLHGLSFNETNRKSYVKQFNFFQDESWVDSSLLKMKASLSTDTIYSYLHKQKKNIKLNKPIRRLKDKMFIGSMFPYLMYQDSILTEKLNHPVYNFAEYENGSIREVPSFMIEIDNHDIDTSTKEGRLELTKWQNKVFQDLGNFILPGTCEFISARSYYLSYVLDLSYDKEEALDIIKGIQFILFNETGYTCDVRSSNIKGLRRIPLSKQQSLHFSAIVTPMRWLNNYYSNSKLSEYVNAYVAKNMSKFKQFCKQNKISSKFQYWTNFNDSSEKLRIRKSNNSEDRQINFDKMISTPLDRNYISKHCPLMVSIMDHDITYLRKKLSIDINDSNEEIDRYKLVKIFVNKYGDRLHTLLGLDISKDTNFGKKMYNNLISSPLYEDKRLSFILNDNFEDNMHERVYDFSGEYPNGDIVDFIEYALISTNDDKKDIYTSFQNTIDFIAELMNVKVKPAVEKKNYIKDFDFSIYKEKFDHYIEKSIKLMSFKNDSFKKLAEVVYNEIYFNSLNFGDISGIYNSQKMLTNEYLMNKTGLSKSMISRYIAFMTGTGIITREVANFTSKNFESMRNKSHQLATILKFTDYSQIDVDANLDHIKEKQNNNLFCSISKWSADTYYQLYGEEGVVRAFGPYKAKTFKPSNISEAMQPFIDVLKSDKPVSTNFIDLDQEWTLKHTIVEKEDNMLNNSEKDNINESNNQSIQKSVQRSSQRSLQESIQDSDSNSNISINIEEQSLQEKKIDFVNTDLNELNNRLKQQLIKQLKKAYNDESITLNQKHSIKTYSNAFEESIKKPIKERSIKLSSADIEASNRILESIIADEPESRKELFRSLRPLKVLLRLSIDELTYSEQILVIKAKTSMFKNADLSQIFITQDTSMKKKSELDEYIEWNNQSKFRNTNDSDCSISLNQSINYFWYD